MNTTLEKIRAQSPCKRGWEKLLKNLGKTKADNKPLAITAVLDSNGLDDALWCLRAVDGCQREMRLYAVDCARGVQHLMTDPRSLAAIDVAERHANGRATNAELAAAWDAAGDAAGDAAWDAARDAAREVQADLLRIVCAEIEYRESKMTIKPWRERADCDWQAEIDELRAASATDAHLLELAQDTATRLCTERDALRAEVSRLKDACNKFSEAEILVQPVRPTKCKDCRTPVSCSGDGLCLEKYIESRMQPVQEPVGETNGN